MESETDMDLSRGFLIKEETCEGEDSVAVFLQATPSAGELDPLDATRGDSANLDSMKDPLSLTNIDDIKQEHQFHITIKREHPWAVQSTSKATMSAGYSSTEEEDASADFNDLPFIKEEQLDELETTVGTADMQDPLALPLDAREELPYIDVGKSGLDAMKTETLITKETDMLEMKQEPVLHGESEPSDIEAQESAVKIGIIENEIDVTPSLAGGADIRRCQHCNYTCLEQDMLEKHMQRKHGHVGRRGKHMCDKCTYSTDNSSVMRNHQLTHTGERTFPCNKCDKAFSRQMNLTQHVRAVHDGVRPHSCSVCGKTFARAGDLTSHQRIHSGTSVVQCERCGKQFTDRSNYVKHIKSHDGVKAHKCRMCSARFVTRSHLTRHMRTHTGQRPNTCVRTVVRRQLAARHEDTSTQHIHTTINTTVNGVGRAMSIPGVCANTATSVHHNGSVNTEQCPSIVLPPEAFIFGTCYSWVLLDPSTVWLTSTDR